MKLFWSTDEKSWLRDGAIAEEARRIEEVMKLRQVVALLVKQMGGHARIYSADMITLPRETVMKTWLDEGGDLNIRVSGH